MRAWPSLSSGARPLKWTCQGRSTWRSTTMIAGSGGDEPPCEATGAPRSTAAKRPARIVAVRSREERSLLGTSARASVLTASAQEEAERQAEPEGHAADDGDDPPGGALRHG